MKHNYNSNSHIAKTIYWGIIMISLALLIIFKCVGLEMGFIAALSIVDLILGVIVLSIFVMSLFSMHLWALPYELAALFLIFEDEIAKAVGRAEEDIIPTWSLILCAILLSVGISMISGVFKKRHRSFCSSFKSDSSNKNFEADNCVKLCSESKYIDCSTFSDYSFSVKMGDADIFFENSENYKGGGTLHIRCHMGDMRIHVPSGWHVVPKCDAFMGNVECRDFGDENGPVLNIVGECRMGNINIIGE